MPLESPQSIKIDQKLIPEFTFGNENFCGVIKALQHNIDARQGIKRTIENHTLTRDASAAAPYKSGIEEYLIQQVNVLYAAHQILVDNRKTDTDLQGLLEEVNTALNQNRANQSEPKIEDFNGRLLQILEKNGVEDPKKKLNLYKEFNSIELPHYHVTTKLSQDGKDRIENRVISSLTDTQKTSLKSMANSVRQNNPAFSRFIDTYLSKIDAGEPCVVPTQLLKEFPRILRNSYEVRIFANDEEVSTIARIGTPANIVDGQNTAIEQLANHFKEGRNGRSVTVIPVILNSPNTLGMNKIDKAIMEALENQGEVSENNCTVTKPIKAPLNAFRRFSKPDFGAYQPIFDQAKEILTKGGLGDNTGINDFLDSKKTKVPEELVQKIQGLQISYGSKKALLNLVQTKAAINEAEGKNWFSRLFDSENRNLNVITRMALVAADVGSKGPLQEEFMESSNTLQDFIVAGSCKSAKDRTGIAVLEAEALILAERKDTNNHANTHPIQIDTMANNVEKRNAERKKLVNSGEAQHLAGCQGGTLGCCGILPRVYAIPGSLKKILSPLLQRCAKFNKIKAKEIKKGGVKSEMMGMAGTLTNVTLAVGMGATTGTPASISEPANVTRKRALFPPEALNAMTTVPPTSPAPPLRSSSSSRGPLSRR